MSETYINMEDLPQDQVVEHSDQFVMFDSTNAKRATVGNVGTTILSRLTFTDPNNDGNIVVQIGGTTNE